jgi:hypothetical protein
MENLKQLTTTASANTLVSGANSARSYVRVINKDSTNATLLRVGRPVDDTDVDKEITISFGSVPSSGSFKLSFDGLGTTAAINHDDNAAAVQAKVRAVTGLGAATVTGTYAAGLVLTLVDVPSFPAPKMAIVENTMQTAGVNTTASLTFGATANQGTYRLKVVKLVDGKFTEIISSPYAHNVSLQTALRQLMNDPALTFSSPTITFVKDRGLIQRVEVIENQVTTTIFTAQLFTLSDVPDGGSFKLKFGDQETAAIDHDDTEAALQTKVRALTGFDDVEVTDAPSDGAFSISFVNVAFDVPMGTVEDNTLVDGVTPVTFVITKTASYSKRAPVTISTAITQVGAADRSVGISQAVTAEEKSTDYGVILAADSEETFTTKQEVYAFGDDAVALDVIEGF